MTKLADALKLHMEVEEKIVYPAISKQVTVATRWSKRRRPSTRAPARFSETSRSCRRTSPGSTVRSRCSRQGISHHVKEEEDEVFPKFRKSVDATELDELGERVAAAKDAAIPA